MGVAPAAAGGHSAASVALPLFPLVGAGTAQRLLDPLEPLLERRQPPFRVFGTGALLADGPARLLEDTADLLEALADRPLHPFGDAADPLAGLLGMGLEAFGEHPLELFLELANMRRRGAMVRRLVDGDRRNRLSGGLRPLRMKRCDVRHRGEPRARTVRSGNGRMGPRSRVRLRPLSLRAGHLMSRSLMSRSLVNRSVHHRALRLRPVRPRGLRSLLHAGALPAGLHRRRPRRAWARGRPRPTTTRALGHPPLDLLEALHDRVEPAVGLPGHSPPLFASFRGGTPA